MKISIITVVKNDVSNLIQTAQSIEVQKKRYRKNIEWILIDGNSDDGTLEFIDQNKEIFDIFISESDDGVYDAMNKGINLATGDGLLFINAGDLLVGNVLDGIKSAPLFLPVNYHDIFGKFKRVKIKSKREGIPNCHQGIIFPRTNLRYLTTYKIASDYDFFLRHNFKEDLKVSDLNGYIYFLPGISSSSYQKRDSEVFEIRKKHFGLFIAFIYEWRNFLKRIVRKFIKK